MRQLWRWLRRRPAAVGFTILAGGNVFGWAQLEAEQHARCEARNDATAASVQIVVDALVRATAGTSEPERVNAFVDDIEHRVDAQQVDC